MAYKNKEDKRRYEKKWYQRKCKLNKRYYADRVRQARARMREWYQELKKDLKCKKCGENTSICLDFHHKDKTKKFMEVSYMVGHCYGKKRILAEIEKCDVLCRNCHAIIEWSYCKCDSCHPN